MDSTSTKILQITDRVIGVKIDGTHANAIQAQFAFAKDIFVGLLSVCDEKNGLAGESLLRTLFEVVTSTVILAKHPEKLGHFVRHGRLTELRMMRFIEQPELRQKLQPRIAATEQEFQQLWNEFRERRWHNLDTKESFVEAEFQPGIYDRYYRRASAIAHGQPYVTVRNGGISSGPVIWRTLSTSSANTGKLLMVFLLQITNRELKLNLDGEINEAGQLVKDVVDQHIAATKDQVNKVLL